MGSDAGNSHIGYSMVNVLFLREHNRIARALAKAYPEWRDDRLFETARNILTVVLIKLTIEEYINHIAPYHFKFTFDPTGFYGQRWYQPNRVAAEFNLLYRWHSLIPDSLRVGGEDLTIDGTIFNNTLITENGLGPMFDDASHQRAGKVCLFNTSQWFAGRTTTQSIEQARRLDLATYNAYRKDCGFPRGDRIRSDLVGHPRAQRAASACTSMSTTSSSTSACSPRTRARTPCCPPCSGGWSACTPSRSS